ncbi:response regulator [uncultured Croceicoccus sp.]|uniref:response regulator n=1 Tax=uncultured Croceicoccus sp. TaxID=1295329 RepID=UPI00262FCF27|nr:response regulator [uncultured Croceicoccus sp.]
MRRMDELPAEQRAEILARRLERSERALRETENALEERMKALDRANRGLRLRETELAHNLAIESALLLGALATAKMVTIYGERARGFSFSDGAAALLGLPDHAEVTMQTLLDVIHPLDRARIANAGREFFAEREPGVAHAYQHRIVRRANGEIRWLSWSIRRERSTRIRPAYVLGAVREITEERRNRRQVRALQLRAERRVAELNRLQAELAKAKDKTDRTLARRQQFITEMAHAIRTPMGGLTGGVELLGLKLAQGDPDLAVVRQSLGELDEIASRLLENAGTDVEHAADLTPKPLPTPIDAVSRGEDMQETPRVLLAEDTESNRYVIERMLEEMGCDVQTVENGAAAVDAVRRGEFDVILMDVMMPIMSGEQATQAIRNLPGPAARTPVIGITAHSLQEERERLLSSGMTACMAKPVRREALESAIRTAMLGGGEAAGEQARFDHQLLRHTFEQLPGAYRSRMRDAAKKDITRYAKDALAAIAAGDDAALSRAAHSLNGVALNVGAVGIVEELAHYREAAGKISPERFRAEVAACLLAFDDLYEALIDSV